MTTAVLLILLGALSRLLPHPPNAVAIGALALYAGARLPRRFAVAVPLAAMALSDFFLDFGTGRAVLTLSRLTIYGTFAAITLAGGLLRGRAGAQRLALFSVAASTVFFLTSNGAVWLNGSLYPLTAAGLLVCYLAAVPFFWNTLLADLLGTAVFFGLDSLARRERARRGLRSSAIAAFIPALLFVPFAARAQTLPPVSDSVVVTATLTPEEEKDLGSAATVITREWIEKSGAPTVLELLRSVPGVDVVRGGEEGALTSLFLRGTNSTQTLVLVDGVRVNSPFFAGYDFSNLTTENVERIEVVRGPFSALYGSDAIGGVIQIFTRPAQTGFSGQVTGEAGNASTQAATAFLTGGSGPVRFAATYRYGHTDGDRPNSDYERNNGSARIEWQPTSAVRLALEGAILDGKGGNPGPVGAENPLSRATFREERIELPATIELSPTNRLGILVGQSWSKPTFDDPLSPYAVETDARILQTRVSDTAVLGRHTVTAVANWERWTVTNVDTFGVNLDDDRTTIWGTALQDMFSFGPFTAMGGVRYDRHSEFGDAVSPRATLVWLSAGGSWKVRASGGSAFRAPTVGELYYPFGANPNLEPERSVSWEVGVESYLVAGGRGEISIFWNDLKDLIVFDFVTGTNENVGRARTRGVEVGWRQEVGSSLALDASYTYLDAENRVTGRPLNRRPRHRGALGLFYWPLPPLEIAARGLFVGRRPDVDSLTFGPTEDPSYFRLDFFFRWDFGAIAPYARLENALDRHYDEAAGFPAPGRRVVGGLDVKF